MKKVIFAFFSIVALTATGFAQKGNNQITPAVELAIPTGDAGDASTLGAGVTIKGLYGVGDAGQISFTTGYLRAGTKKEYKDLLGADKINSTMIPLLAGYRHHFKGFYAEPQIGYGIYGAKIKGGEYASSDSEGAFTWAAGIGYIYNNFELGARYQSMHKDGESSGFVGIRIGYNFSVNVK